MSSLSSIVRSWRIVAIFLIFMSEGSNAQKVSIDRQSLRSKQERRGLGKGKSKACRDAYGNGIDCPPTASPSMSLVPSTAPSPSPSVAPSALPSVAPSPAPSVEPSAHPTLSIVPSGAPSDSPTTSPSSTPSSAPTSAPTTSPAPTSNPSAHPSSNPSEMPTSSPSISMSPSEAVFSRTVEDGTEVTTCLNPPPASPNSILSTSRPKYVYYLYMNATSDGEEAQDVADNLKPQIHYALAREAMDCNYFGSFALTKLGTVGSDIVSGSCPGITPDEGETCWQVDAEILTTLFYVSFRRRNLIETDVVGDFIAWMEAIFSKLDETDARILSVEFQGFSDLDLDGTEYTEPGTSTTTDGTSQANSGNFAINGDGKKGGGIFILAAAGAGLVVVVMVIIARRNRRQEAYREHLEEVEKMELEESDTDSIDYPRPETKGVIVAEMEMDYENERNDDRSQKYYEGIQLEDANHDYRACASPNCETCQRKLIRPVFISTDTDDGTEIVMSMTPREYQPRREGAIKVNDTQSL